MNEMNDTVDVVCGSAPSFLIAIPIMQDNENQQDNSSDSISNNFSLNLLPLSDLVARVCASLKQNKAADDEGVVFMVGGLLLDSSRHLVQKKGRTLRLTPTEFKLLHSLMVHAGKPVPYASLLRSVWGTQYGCERGYLRIYVRLLRMKIEDDPSNPKYLLTEPYIGYRFAESVDENSVIPSSESIA